MATHCFRISLPGRETGKTPRIAILRHSDRKLLDFHDNTFKSSGWTEPEEDMIEIASELASPPSAVDGEYYFEWTIPTIPGIAAYEAMTSEEDSGAVARETLVAIDGQVDLSSKFPIEVNPASVTSNTLGQKWLGDHALVFGDMENIDSDSYVLKSPNGDVLVTFSRGQTGSGFYRTRT